MNKVKIGIMGGTFDPIHNGHLMLAEYSRTAFGLKKVLFIPTGNPAHKSDKVISSVSHRYNMTLLGINTNPYFYLSSIEIQRKGTTYTIDTIRYLKDKYENIEFYFILGSDSFFNICKWKDYEELLSLCKFIIAKRPNVDNQSIEDEIIKLGSKYKESIHTLEAPLIDISSTNIRNKVKNSISIKYLVPEAIEFYIKNNKLYK